jgi:protein-arginine kinase activator protein McsA
MKKLINKVLLPIKSRLDNKEYLTDAQVKRLEVCKMCPHNSENVNFKSFLDKIKIFLNTVLNILTGVKEKDKSVCLLCGCQLIFKSAQKDKENMCEIGKWDNL